MELSSWATYLATILASIFLLLLLKSLFSPRRRHCKLNLPPGPKPWPVIGNLNLLGSLPHRSLHALSQKYGALMHLYFGSFPVIVASSVDTAKLILKTHDVTFCDRPKTAVGKYTANNYSDIGWSQYGPYWRQARKICMIELFSAGRLDHYQCIRVEEVKNLLRDLFNSSGRPVNFHDHLSNVFLNIISRMVLGKKYLDKSEGAVVPPEEFKAMFGEFSFLNGVTNIGDSIPWLDFLDLQGYIKRMKKIGEKFDRFFEHVLDEHNERRRREGDKFVAEDMVDVLLQLADDPDLEVKLERRGAKAIALDLIAGGTETTSVTMDWAMSELLKRPEIFKKATEELDRVIGRHRWVEEKEVHHLPYIEAIIKETMRMHPLAPMLVPRQCREDCRVAGYDIPAGTRVLVNVWTIGRDPTIWDAPEEFRPERFIGSTIDVTGQDFELLPFGSGRRMCPGYRLGLVEVQLSLANLLHGFAWRLPDGMKVEDLSMEEICGLPTSRKVPLEVVAEPKLPAHLYAV